MSARTSLAAAAILLSAPLLARGAENFDQAMTREAARFDDRVAQAGRELNETRNRIADEKAPLLARLHAAEERIVAAEQAASTQRLQNDQFQSRRSDAVKRAEAITRNQTYDAGLASDALKAFATDLGAEDPDASARVDELQRALADTSGNRAQAAAQAAEFLADRVQRSLGGYASAGQALLPNTNDVLNGTAAHLGPITYFLSADGRHAGVAMASTDEADMPVLYPLPDWSADSASALVAGRPTVAPADATGDKAQRLSETTGDVWTNVRRGGWVALVILAAGACSILLILRKLMDLSQIKADDAAGVGAFLRVLKQDPSQAQAQLSALKPSTRRLFAVGLAHREESPEALDERLEAELLRQRLHGEHYLPLLAVIATAAPLLGLLGTVVGLVRTFALITVFGTGNAGKLASGISEVLIATELGLLVAVPTLIAHGFLSHRIQGQLAALERQAIEFLTAIRLLS